MRIAILAFMLISYSVGSAQISKIEGTWIIDLRPDPKSDAYLKDFVVKLNKDTGFSGQFYDTNFKNGKLNNSWPDKVYFGFTTKDKSNEYSHTGYFQNGYVYGTTLCVGRDFIMPWVGEKKVE